MVNFKQMMGLIALSVGVLLTIYALREGGHISLLIAALTLALGGSAIALIMNK